MRWIYLSPHFDDAVLSCGGLIWEQTQKGTQVEIWTINAGDPVDEPGSAMIARVHAMWQTGTPRQTVTQRRLSKEPLDKGGWSIFPSGFPPVDYADPVLGGALRTNGKDAWVGWPENETIERLPPWRPPRSAGQRSRRRPAPRRSDSRDFRPQP